MCVNNIRTQELKWGTSNFSSIAGGFHQGVVFWPGRDAQRGPVCKDGTRVILIPKVMGIATRATDGDGNIISTVTAEVRAYMADNWRVQSILDDKATAFAQFDALQEKKFAGGFYSGDVGKREMYLTNFGSGFPAAVPASGGSDTSYGVALIWSIASAEVGDSTLLIDWGWEKSFGVGL